MAAEPRTEPMAKKQTNFLLDDDLREVLQSYCDASGIAFARVMTAAALQFIFQNPCRPDRDWIRLALAVDRGEISAADVPFRYLSDRIEMLQRKLTEPNALREMNPIAPAITLRVEQELRELRAKLECLEKAEIPGHRKSGEAPDRLSALRERAKEDWGVDAYPEVFQAVYDHWITIAKLQGKMSSD